MVAARGSGAGTLSGWASLTWPPARSCPRHGCPGGSRRAEIFARTGIAPARTTARQAGSNPPRGRQTGRPSLIRGQAYRAPGGGEGAWKRGRRAAWGVGRQGGRQAAGGEGWGGGGGGGGGG